MSETNSKSKEYKGVLVFHFHTFYNNLVTPYRTESYSKFSKINGKMNISYFSSVPQFSWLSWRLYELVLPFPVRLYNGESFPLQLRQTCLIQKSQPEVEMK